MLTFPRNCLESAQSLPRAQKVPLSKELQGHEGEHEEAEHEEQEDVGDLWQRVADAAEGSPDLPGTKGGFRGSLAPPCSPHHPTCIKPLSWAARVLSPLFSRGIPQGKAPATQHSEPRDRGPQDTAEISRCREPVRDTNPSLQATEHKR